MKIKLILAVGSLMIFPVMGLLAQTSDGQVAPIQSTSTATQKSSTVFPSKTAETPKRCGVYGYKFYNECSTPGNYKNVYAQCFDGSEVTLGDTTVCQSYEIWTRLANDACADNCETPQSLPKPPMPVISEVSKPVSVSPTPGVSQPITLATSPSTKCGVSSFATSNECGVGVYKNVSARCYDGFEVTLGEKTSCKSSELWNQYVKEVCASHCSKSAVSGTVPTVGGSGTVSTEVPTPIFYYKETTEGGNRSTPLGPSSVPIVAREWVSVCTTIDTLNQNYNESILELQKQEARSDKIKTADMTRSIENLKQYTEAAKKVCATDPQTAWLVAAPPKESGNKPVATVESKPVVMAMDRCDEMTQWENKIAYYKKLGNLKDTDLKKEGFSRKEIEDTLRELAVGTEKVRTQCVDQRKRTVAPKITAATRQAFIAETVKPVVAESGQEIREYYETGIEKAVSVKGEEKQMQELKTLKVEVNGLISNLIKSRKELEVSEFDTLVKEVKISRGEIKADDISVKTIEKKMFVNVGDRAVSVEPTEKQVLIRDKGLEVKTDEVTIKKNVLSVGGVDVQMSASEVTEKLGLTPTTIELKEENAKAVYTMKIDERRKLFWFIPLNVQRTVVADAENGNTLSEYRPWYNFLTAK